MKVNRTLVLINCLLSFTCTWYLFWADYKGDISFINYLAWRMADIGYWVMAILFSIPVAAFFTLVYYIVMAFDKMLVWMFRKIRMF